jgi:SAM-dependent methyltransferase
MPEYVLPHSLAGERDRLELMSRLLDPMHQRHLEALGPEPGWRCLEVGAGNGSVSAWLAGRVGPDGRATAVDIDTRFMEGLACANLEVRRLDLARDPIEAQVYDLVTARAVLHHLPSRWDVLERLVAAAKPGGRLLFIEPDCFLAPLTEPAAARQFWRSWLEWASAEGIDYFAGRELPARLAGLGVEGVEAAGELPLFRGGSLWASWYLQSLEELRPRMLGSGRISEPQLDMMRSLLSDPDYWTMVTVFTACWGRKPGE